jgi:hypothetical protein
MVPAESFVLCCHDGHGQPFSSVCKWDWQTSLPLWTKSGSQDFAITVSDAFGCIVLAEIFYWKREPEPGDGKQDYTNNPHPS